MRYLLFLPFITCFLLSMGSAKAVMLFADEFNDSTITTGWEINNVEGVSISLNTEPGKLFVENDGAEAFVHKGDSARLSFNAPSGDFEIETQVYSQTQSGYWCVEGGKTGGPALFITFNNREKLAWIHQYDFTDQKWEMQTVNTLTNEYLSSSRINSLTYPIRIKIKRNFNVYTFSTKAEKENDWTDEKTVILENTPVAVGLMFTKSFGCGRVATSLGYFHLEALAPDGPAPSVSALSSSAVQPGITLLMNGQNFLPGYSLLLFDGRPLPALFSTATQAVFQVPITATIGSHTLAVQTGVKTSNNFSLSVTSDQPSFMPLPFGGTPYDVNGDGKVDVLDAVLVLRKAVGLP